MIFMLQIYLVCWVNQRSQNLTLIYEIGDGKILYTHLTRSQKYEAFDKAFTKIKYTVD